MVNRSPKISVIVPVYNSELYLRKCLDSLRFQTYENIEIICIDDGSTDCSLEILNEYKALDSRFIVYSSKNSGTSVARNKGLSTATGDYISFIDSDDWVLLTLYETFVETVSQVNSIVDIYMFNAAAYRRGQNDVIPRVFFELSDWNNHKSPYQLHTFKDCQRPFSRNLSAANRIYRTDFLREKDLKFAENLKYEDQAFCIISLLHAKTILLTDEIFYRYRHTDDISASVEVTPRCFDIFKVLDLIDADIYKLNLYETYKYALFQYKYNVFNQHYKYCPPKMREAYFKEMKSRLTEAERHNLDVRIYPKLNNYKLYEFIKNNGWKEFEHFYNKH